MHANRERKNKNFKLRTSSMRDVNNRNKQTLMCAIGISSSYLQSFVSITRCHLLHIIKSVVCKSAWAWLNNNSYLCLWKEFLWKFIHGIAFQRVWFTCFLCICYVFSLRTTHYYRLIWSNWKQTWFAYISYADMYTLRHATNRPQKQWREKKPKKSLYLI